MGPVGGSVTGMRTIKKLLSFLGGDNPLRRWLRFLVFLAFPLLVGFVTWRAVATTYPPPPNTFTIHPAPPDWVAEMEAPPWVAEPTAQVLERGKPLYEKNCLYCHGESLDGKGPQAAGINYPIPPVDFRDPNSIAGLPLPFVFWKVKEGGLQNQFNSAMPAWGVGIYSPEETVHTGDLTEEEMWQVIAYIFHEAEIKPTTGGFEAEAHAGHVTPGP